MCFLYGTAGGNPAVRIGVEQTNKSEVWPLSFGRLRIGGSDRKRRLEAEKKRAAGTGHTCRRTVCVCCVCVGVCVCVVLLYESWRAAKKTVGRATTAAGSLREVEKTFSIIIIDRLNETWNMMIRFVTIVGLLTASPIIAGLCYPHNLTLKKKKNSINLRKKFK